VENRASALVIQKLAARTRCQTPLLMPEGEQAASLPLADKTEKAVRKIWHPPEKVRESMDGLD
jgi:hypothetical protein